MEEPVKAHEQGVICPNPNCDGKLEPYHDGAKCCKKCHFIYANGSSIGWHPYKEFPKENEPKAHEQEGVDGDREIHKLCFDVLCDECDVTNACTEHRDCENRIDLYNRINQLITSRIAEAVKKRDKYIMNELKARNTAQMFINVFKEIVNR